MSTAPGGPRPFRLEFEDVTFGYGPVNIGPTIVERLTGRVATGRPLLVTGPNGCGKSTLLGIIGGRLVPWRGIIRSSDLQLDVLHPRLSPWLVECSAMVSQRPMDSLCPHLTLAENVVALLAGESFHPFDPYRASDGLRAVESDVIESFPDYSRLRRNTVSELSGGQAQLFALSLQTVTRRPMVLLDEPTSSLDELRRRSAIRLVERLWTNSRCAVALATHDLALIDLISQHRHERIDLSRRPQAG